MCLTHYYQVCVVLEAALEIKVGPTTGITRTEIVVLQPFEATGQAFEVIGIVALLVTNTIATLMILYKTWCCIYLLCWTEKLTSIRIYLTVIKVHFQNQHKSTQVEQVLFLLVESGSAYISIWVSLLWLSLMG